ARAIDPLRLVGFAAVVRLGAAVRVPARAGRAADSVFDDRVARIDVGFVEAPSWVGRLVVPRRFAVDARVGMPCSVARVARGVVASEDAEALFAATGRAARLVVETRRALVPAEALAFTFGVVDDFGVLRADDRAVPCFVATAFPTVRFA